MKKEEFPTFLNQQPTVVFGRTGREVLIIVCGIVSGYVFWGSIHTLLHAPWWNVLCLILAIVPVLIALIVALIPVAERPLEEWAMCWFLYACMAKLFLYEPQEEDLWDIEERQQQTRGSQKDDPFQADSDEN